MNSFPTDPLDDLIHGYLDDRLSVEREAELNDRLKADPAAARRFTDLARLHDRLADLHRADSFAGARPRLPRRSLMAAGLAAAMLLVAGLAWWGLPTRSTVAGEIQRLIESSSEARDRSYRIRSLDPEPEITDGRRPPIDGATLDVRKPGEYVLTRRWADGRLFVTGSDGERSFSIPPEGVVRVSNDPLRFRGPVPGQQQGIPFADLRSDLIQLRDAYELTFLEPSAEGRRGLVGRKKSADFRGARRVELWYDPRTGVIDRMIFRGMPRARGGPDALSVDLIDQRPLGNDHFQHEAHHARGRRVVLEE